MLLKLLKSYSNLLLENLKVMNASGALKLCGELVEVLVDLAHNDMIPFRKISESVCDSIFNVLQQLLPGSQGAMPKIVPICKCTSIGFSGEKKQIFMW